MKRGLYLYTMFHPVDNSRTNYSLRVEIIGETVKSYRVRYLSYHQNGNGPGYVTWVRRRKVKLCYGHYN